MKALVMHTKTLCPHTLSAALIALTLSACGGSDSATAEAITLDDSIQVQTASTDIARETLPFIGIVDTSEINAKGRDADHQYLYPFAGFESTYGDSTNLTGNAKVGTEFKLKARLYPNLEKLSVNERIKVYVIGLLRGTPACAAPGEGDAIQWRGLTGDMDDQGVYQVPAEVLKGCAAHALQVLDPSTHLDLEINFAPRENPLTFDFHFAFERENGELRMVTKSADQAQPASPSSLGIGNLKTIAKTSTAVNDTTKSELPPHVTSYGSFRPSTNGFGFANVNDVSYNLYEASDIARSYGQDAVCFVKDGECVGMTPWGYFVRDNLGQFQAATKGGLCFGFAGAAMAIHQHAFFDGKKKVSDYNPKASSSIELNYEDVKKLIANAFMAQLSTKSRVHESSVCATLTPSDVLRTVDEGFNTYDPIAVITMFAPSGAGHAVTPWAISDEGDGIRRIYVYDNNYPSDSTRYITVNTQNESWFYASPVNPGAEVTTFEGSGTDNTMCPFPMSYTIKDTEIATQPAGTTRFIDFSGKNSQVEDSRGNLSGADFSKTPLQEINNIPNAKLEGFNGFNSLIIPQPDAPVSMAFEALAGHFDEMYTVRAQSVDEAPEQSFKVQQSAINQAPTTQPLKPAYTLITEMNQVRMSDTITFKAHPSARIATLEDVGATETAEVILIAYTTLNPQAPDEQPVGYQTALTVPGQAVSKDSVGFFIEDNGRDVSVFQYNKADVANTIERLPASGIDMEIQQFNADGTTEMLVSAE